jgi:hypothetical protein
VLALVFLSPLLDYSITRLSPSPSEDSLESWLDILGSIPLEFWIEVEDIRHPDPSSAKARSYDPCPKAFQRPQSMASERKIQHQSPGISHQAPGTRIPRPHSPWIPGIRHLRPPHPLWLVSLGAPGLHLAITTLGPGGATALVLNDHTVSLDQAFQVDPFSLSNHPREASDLFYLPVHRLRHWSWPSHASPQPYTTHPQ